MNYSPSKYVLRFAYVIITCCISAGCGQSFEDQHLKEEMERKQQLKILQEMEQNMISKIAIRHNALYFPPESVNSTAFSYEIQSFFKDHAQETFIFKGYLEDIEQSDDDLFITYLCPLVGSIMTGKNVYFKLRASLDYINQLQKEHKRHGLLSMKIFNTPDYYVVAKIEKCNVYTNYNYDMARNGEDINTMRTFYNYIACSGILIEAVSRQ
jgi:hypothetical protein